MRYMRWCEQSALFPAQQARCCYHYYWSKVLLGSQLPLNSLSSTSLPKLFLPGSRGILNYTYVSSSSSFPLPILTLASWSDALAHPFSSIGVVLAVSGLRSSPPRWGEVFISMQLGCFVFGVSHSVPRDTALSASEMCPLKGQARNTQLPVLTEAPHLCLLVIGPFPGCCT